MVPYHLNVFHINFCMAQSIHLLVYSQISTRMDSDDPPYEDKGSDHCEMDTGDNSEVDTGHSSGEAPYEDSSGVS